MEKYRVEILRTMTHVAEVEAESPEDALIEARDIALNLIEDDFSDTGMSDDIHIYDSEFKEIYVDHT